MKEGFQRLEAYFCGGTALSLAGGWAFESSHPFISTVFYLAAFGFGGWFGVQGGIQSLRERRIDVDLLMVLAALGAAWIGHPFEGGMLLFLFSLSNVLQDYAMARTEQAIRALSQLRPTQATVRRNEELVTMPIESVTVGEIVIVRPGERIPLDGVVTEGESTLDQASITGESLPVPKSPGDLLFAGTINQKGSLFFRVTQSSKNSTIARFVELVEQARGQKAKTERFLDTFEQYYAIAVLLFTGSLILFPALIGTEPFSEIVYRAMTVMVVASPCALVISTPASILSAIANAGRHGVLLKGGLQLEQLARIRVIAVDKTGTLTEGKPVVSGLWRAPGSPCRDDDELLQLAASVDLHSEHPVAQAVVQEARERGLTPTPPTHFQSKTGFGVEAEIEGRRYIFGGRRFFERQPGFATTLTQLHCWEREGKSVLLLAEQTETGLRMVGALAVADRIRPEASTVIRQLKEMGIRQVVLLSGDNARVAAAIAREAGVDSYEANLLPEDKVERIKALAAGGPVAMIGDGINDAPALSAATIGIAMGAAGSEIAMESADVVLMASDLTRIPYAIALSRKTRAIVIQNLVFAIGVILILIASALGAHLPLTLGVIGHEGSTVLVCLNGLRLLWFKKP